LTCILALASTSSTLTPLKVETGLVFISVLLEPVELLISVSLEPAELLVSVLLEPAELLASFVSLPEELEFLSITSNYQS
jgi:hypothetical protein